MQADRTHGLDADLDTHGPGKREVDLYVRTYTTLLQSSGAISVASLEPAHITSASSLHAGALEPEPDLNAFIYSVQRLPASIVDVRMIVLGQQQKAFTRAGYANLSKWETQSAPGRRRRWLFDGDETLAAYIASSSDLDDLIPTIVAYQIEWNKMHRIVRDDDRLGALIDSAGAAETDLPADEIAEIGERLLLSTVDWLRLQSVWAGRLWRNLGLVAAGKKRYELMMVGGSYVGYIRSTRQWWAPVDRLLREHELDQRPIYFVSSNMHSFANVLSGTARRRERELTEFVRTSTALGLADELAKIESGRTQSSLDNLLYFAARPYFALPENVADRDRRAEEELERGIYHIEPRSSVDVGVQVIDLRRTDPSAFDPRLCRSGEEALDPSATDAIIVNVNYPLGFAAYHLLSQVSMATEQMRGIYILGKAATLNGRIGDVMLANVVFDEHSGNTYWFDNCFGYQDVAPFLLFGAALDNQKAVTVKGTYLQNQGYLDFYYRENFTVVEMEAGPYISAIYEDSRLERHPSEQAINLRGAVGHDIDLGIIHYASDTPYTRAQTLGARGMSFYGMDSTYASTIAILRRIFQKTGVLTRRAGEEASRREEGAQVQRRDV
jgi:hypothetical protein